MIIFVVAFVVLCVYCYVMDLKINDYSGGYKTMCMQCKGIGWVWVLIKKTQGMKKQKCLKCNGEKVIDGGE